MKGKQPQQQKRHEEPPSLAGVSHLTPYFVHTVLCPTPMVSTRGLWPRFSGGGG